MDFGYLYNNIDTAFEKSDIKRFAEEKGYQWNYSLTSTTINLNSLLLVGFNWGAGKDQKYMKQKYPPNISFTDQDLGSFKRILPFLNTYFTEVEISKIVQTNFCPFRSHSEDQISKEDINLGSPIFLKFVDLISPTLILSFSASLKNYLNNTSLFKQTFTHKLETNKGLLQVSEGYLSIESKKIPIKFLPHPNYPLNGASRKIAWDSLLSNKI